MSLIHWWPLNGDLKDYGVNNNTLANNGSVTFSGAGKIGQCANVTSGKYLSTSDSLFSSYTCLSVSYWMKLNEEPSSDWYDIWSVGDFRAEIYSGHYMWTGYSDDVVSTASIAVEPNTWIHFVHVLDVVHKTYKVYRDGVQIRDISFTSTQQLTGAGIVIGQGILNIDFNDFRIYNHALSAKEVKEISKGLVLHYNFEDPYVEGTTNLASYDWVTYWNNSGDASRNFNDTNLVSPVNSKIMSQTQTTAGQSAFGLGLSSIALPSQTITVSVWFFKKGAASNDSVGPFVRDGDTDEWLGMFSYNGSDNYRDWPSGTWLFLTQTITTSSSAGRPYICCYTGGQDEYFAFTGWQIEQKDHATPYINGTRPNGLIYDNSGYGYNGTQVDCSIVEPSDNKSGKCGLRTNTSGYVQLPEIFLDKTFTISTWCKHLDSFSAWARIFDFGNAVSGQNYDVGLATSDSSGTTYLFGRVAGGSLPDRHVDNMDFNWHLFTIVVDYDSIKYYKDGALVDSFTANGDVGGVLYTLNYLNKSNWSGDGVSNKYYADFKIFNTALSAEDILLEYNRKASIDKNGNLFAPYVKEHENTNNLLSYVNYRIASQDSLRWYLSVTTKDNYEAHKNDADYAYNYSLGAYTQANLSVTMTNQGIRIYSTPNDSYENYDQWGGICISPMAISECLVKGHRYRVSWHAKGQSSRSMNEVYFSSQIGWGTSTTNPNTTTNKLVTTPVDFNGEMDCFWDFTINDDIFKVCTDNGGNNSFSVGETYLSYAGLKLGFTYENTGPLGTDIYITDLQLHDLTTGEVYKIENNGIVKTIELVSGRRNSARLHSDGVIDATDIKEC